MILNTGGGAAHVQSREDPAPLDVCKQTLADHVKKKDEKVKHKTTEGVFQSH